MQQATLIDKYTKYYKVKDVAWTRPNLSSNGSLGGSSFAVQPSFSNGSYSAGGDGFYAFDGNEGTAWGTYWERHSGDRWITIYNPLPLKVSSFVLTFRQIDVDWYYLRRWTNVYASNDNSSWVTLYTRGEVTQRPTDTLEINSTGYYKYHKIDIGMGGSDHYDGFGMQECKINAVYQTTVEDTSEDYTYKQDHISYAVPKIEGKYYSIKTEDK